MVTSLPLQLLKGVAQFWRRISQACEPVLALLAFAFEVDNLALRWCSHQVEQSRSGWISGRERKIYILKRIWITEGFFSMHWPAAL